MRRESFHSAQRRVVLATMFCYLFYYTGRQTFGFAIPGIEEELGLSYTASVRPSMNACNPSRKLATGTS